MIVKPTSCQGCPLHSPPYGSALGFLKPSGDFRKGVVIVGEAAGEQEEQAGLAFVGKSGYYLWNNLRRVGLERDDFRIANVLSCRPPNNKLVGMPYERDAIAHCGHHLDSALAHARSERGDKPLVILTLGKTAFKRVLGLTELHTKLLKLDYLCYPFWSETYKAWVIAADHPSYLMRGNHHLVSVLQYAALRAVDIARDGLVPQPEDYIIDPDPMVFDDWVNTYVSFCNDVVLSYDIETLMKKDMDEEAVAKEDDPDYTILRVGFSYKPYSAVTIPWRSEYMPALRRLFESNGPKVGWNNENYDNPRIRRHTNINGDCIDAMLGWHVLNSALPKGLGFVAPFYAKRSPMWKHLSDVQAAWYNAKDADIQWQCWQGIATDLVKANLWDVFDNHVIKLNRVFNYMSQQGVQRDETLRNEAEAQLGKVLISLQESMDSAVPAEAKAGKFRVGNYCPACKARDVKIIHFKSVGKKKLKAGEVENPCHGNKAIKEKVLVHLEPFKLSNVSLQRYQGVLKHKPILDSRVKPPKITFDEKAMLRLMRNYPDDVLYPLVGKFRQTQKLLSTYIGVTEPDGRVRGGLPIGKDGLIHTHFTHNPSTLRSASQNPNLQNLYRPNPKDPSDPVNYIRRLVVARDGHVFLARDFSGIEAVLVGYAAAAPHYIRLAKRDVHSFYTAYALNALDGRISANDLPQLSWDDDRLFTRLAEIKKEFKQDRDALYKHLVHGANYMQSPRGAAEKIFAETGVEFDVKLVRTVMEIYFDLFPEIRQWHKSILAQADKDGYVRNAFGYVHRFYRIFEWDKVGDQWQREPGPDANKVIAFGPQSNAAGIIKDSMNRLYYERFEEAGQYLRLLVHDELFCEVPKPLVSDVDAVLRIEMEKPITCMPLPPEWGMGPYLNINTEEKIGSPWGDMR